MIGATLVNTHTHTDSILPTIVSSQPC